MSRGCLIILSGPSGSGKGTILKPFLEQRDDTVVSISATTRAPRPGEIEGVHYYFRTREQFEQMIREDRLLEYAEYNGNYYGTPREPVEKWLGAGKNVLLEIEVQGAEKVMDRCEDAVSVFLTAPSLAEIERRLRKRNTEPEEIIQKRMATARREIARAFRYRYVLLNDEVEQAVAGLHAIIQAEKMRYDRMKDYIREELQDAQTDGH